ncbi:hypothetical protein FOZ63_032700 [Perkinsus olseni]|uniref:Uncharacterized protein n=1 Tax=Perkinsus olseni TaxID=32597 RepID=A0A7J6Q713_PEROL|nr:hypothetical protein FOZ62_001828 [Perkinsus olseni]KAF4750206.1 hypothetical protein FOZ63_032700 [Perkinsus olseni]
MVDSQVSCQELNATTHMLRYNIVQSEIVPSGSPGEARMRVTLTQDHIVQGKPIELKAPWEAAESTKINADEFENAVELSVAYESDKTLESSNGECGPSDATVLIITEVLARHLINRLAQKLLLSSVVPG